LHELLSDHRRRPRWEISLDKIVHHNISRFSSHYFPVSAATNYPVTTSTRNLEIIKNVTKRFHIHNWNKKWQVVNKLTFYQRDIRVPLTI